MILNEGQKVSGYIKNSNRIHEGIIILNKLYEKVVLNEENKWVKLSDLSHVKLIEADFALENNKITKYADAVKQTVGEIKQKDPDGKALERFGTDPALIDEGTKALDMKIKAMPTIEDKDKASEEEIKKAFTSEIQTAVGEKAGEENEGSGDEKATEEAQAAMDKFQDKITETFTRLHPSLQPHLFEMNNQVYQHCHKFFNKTHDKFKSRKMLELYGMSEHASKKTVDEWEKFAMEIGDNFPKQQENMDFNNIYKTSKLEEGFMSMTTTAARSKGSPLSIIPKMMPSETSNKQMGTNEEIKNVIKSFDDDNEMTMQDLIDVLKMKFPGEPIPKLRDLVLEHAGY